MKKKLNSPKYRWMRYEENNDLCNTPSSEHLHVTIVKILEIFH